jgi:hypothetical protein
MPRPALKRASPSGAVAGSYVAIDHQEVSVFMDDGPRAELDASAGYGHQRQRVHLPAPVVRLDR